MTRATTPITIDTGQALSPATKTVVMLELPWAAMSIDPTAGPAGVAEGIQIGLHRASHAPTCAPIPAANGAAGASGLLGQKEVDAILEGLVWSSWIVRRD